MRKDDHEQERDIAQEQNFAVQRSLAAAGYRVGREAAGGEAHQPSPEVRQRLEQAWALLAQLQAQVQRSRGTDGRPVRPQRGHEHEAARSGAVV